MLRFGLAWSRGAESKICICAYISVKNKYPQKLHVTLSTVSLSQAASKPFQCFYWEIFISNSASASAQVTTSPHPSSLQTLRSAYGKGHSNSHNICLHNTECSSEKYSPWSPLPGGCVPIKKTTLKKSSSSLTRCPRGGSPGPEAASHGTEPSSPHLSEAAGYAGCLCLSSPPFRNLF